MRQGDRRLSPKADGSGLAERWRAFDWGEREVEDLQKLCPEGSRTLLPAKTRRATHPGPRVAGPEPVVGPMLQDSLQLRLLRVRDDEVKRVAA